MDFSDGIKAHAKRVAEFREHCATEEATKMALIVPFMRFLGYEPNDPRVVIPEYCADFGGKKECKVDYAIKRCGEIVMIVEAKKVGEVLDGAKEAQLQQYFQSLLSVKIAILTDGVIYKFYTDLEAQNVMDKTPFMTLDFSAIDETLIPELKKLCNECFDLGTALSAAQDLKYLGQIKQAFIENLENPEEDFVRYFMRKAEVRATPRAVEQFTAYTKRAFNELMDEQVEGRLKTALSSTSKNEKPPVESEKNKEDPVYILGNLQGDGIETTPNEVEGYYIVRAIVSSIAAPDRIIARDTVGHCNILFDDNQRKPICRLRFNNPAKLVLETIDQVNKVSTLNKLETVSDIYKFAGELLATVEFYMKA